MTDVCHQLKDILILFEAFHLSYPLVAYFPMCMKSLAYIHLHLPIILTFASLVPIAIVSSILSESYQRTHESKDGVKSAAKNAPSKVAHDGNLVLLWFIAWATSQQFFCALVGRSGFKSFLLHWLPDLWNWYGISGAQISCASGYLPIGCHPFLSYPTHLAREKKRVALCLVWSVEFFPLSCWSGQRKLHFAYGGCTPSQVVGQG